MAVTKIDLNKLPPRATSAINDTTKLVKLPRSERIGSALGKFVKPLVPYAKVATRALGLPATALAATGTTLFSDRDKAPEDRTFPKAGMALDEVDRLGNEAQEKNGTFSGVLEGIKGIPSLAGNLGSDIYDRTSNFYKDQWQQLWGTGKYDRGDAPDIEHTPGAAAAIEANANARANSVTKPAPTPVGTATNNFSSPYDALLLDRLGRRGESENVPARPVNNSYFINNQSGEAPGERQYFKDLPVAFPQREGEGLPQVPQVSGRTPEANSAYESPMVAAIKNLKLPDPNTTPANYGDLLRRNFQTTNQITNLLPALARTKEQAEQQRRDEVSRGFGLTALGLGQDNTLRTDTLDLAKQQATETTRQNDLSNIIRLRGQDRNAQTRIALAGAKGESKSRTYKQRLEDQDSLTELSLRRYPDAPAGFAEAVPGLINQGFTEDQVQEAYDWVSEIQSRNTGTPVSELDVNNLYTQVAERLGGR